MTLFFLIIFLIVVDFAYGSTVAVCIGGQTARMLPSLLSPLFQDNSELQFKLFYTLQSSNNHDVRYWSDRSYTYEPSKYGKMDRSEILSSLMVEYKNLTNVEIGAVEMIQGLSAEEWSSQHFNNKSLSVVRLPMSMPEIVLNMFQKQNTCADQILQYEAKHSLKLNYVFWAREDLHLYNAMKLSNLAAYLQGSASVPSTVSATGGACQVITRSCLTHGGVALRGYFWTRKVALPAMQGRFDFYRKMQSANTSFVTVEEFERDFLASLSATVCPVEVDHFPTVAVRHVKDGDFCIPPMEVAKGCYPMGAQSYVQHKRCHRNADAVAAATLQENTEKQARRHDMKLRQQQGGRSSRNSDATAALPEETEDVSAVDMAQVRSIQAPTKAGKEKKGRSKEELTGLLQQAEFKVRALEKKISSIVSSKAAETKIVRSELVSTKKRLSDAQQSLAGKEAQLLNLKSAYDKMAQELQSLRAGALPKSLV